MSVELQHVERFRRFFVQWNFPPYIAASPTVSALGYFFLMHRNLLIRSLFWVSKGICLVLCLAVAHDVCSFSTTAFSTSDRSKAFSICPMFLSSSLTFLWLIVYCFKETRCARWFYILGLLRHSFRANCNKTLKTWSIFDVLADRRRTVVLQCNGFKKF